MQYLNRIIIKDGSKTVKIIDIVNFLEKSLKMKAKKKFVNKQPGEMLDTLSNSKKLRNNFRLKFNTPFNKGMRSFFGFNKKSEAK